MTSTVPVRSTPTPAQPARQCPHHAIDTSAAASAPGVVAVFTGKDMAADEIGGLPCGWLIHSKDGSAMAEPPHPVLAVDRVRHVGDPVAAVIAETPGTGARRGRADCCRLRRRAGGCRSGRGAETRRAALWPEQAPGDICYDWHLGDPAAVDAAIARAARVVKLDLINNRLVPNAMEPRAAIGEFDRATDEFTLYTTSQNPHVIRLLMGAFVLHIPEARLRVVAPDVGGGFGSKIYHYAEEAIVTWAAGKVRKPIKWTAERSESFMSDAHGRDHVTHVELALDANAKFTALKVSTVANMGAYLSTFATCIPTYLYGTLLAGTYTTPAIYVETKAVFTNTVPVDAYRGAGRPEATFLLERIVDLAADELGMDPAELRQRNFIPADAFPYQTPVALQYDSGDYQTTLRMALERPTTPGSRRAVRRRPTAANTAASVSQPLSRPAASALGRGRLAWRARRAVRVGRGSGASDWQRHGADRVARARSGTRRPCAAHRRPSRRIVRAVEIVHGDTAKIPYGMGASARARWRSGAARSSRRWTRWSPRGARSRASARSLEAGYEFKEEIPRRRHDREKTLGRDRADRLCAAQFPA